MPKLQNTDAYTAYVKSLENRIVLLEGENQKLVDRLDRLEDRFSELARDVMYKDDDYDY